MPASKTRALRVYGAILLALPLMLFVMCGDGGAAEERPAYSGAGSIRPVVSQTDFTLVIEGVADAAYRVWQSQTPPKVVIDLGLEAQTPDEIEVGDRVVERVRVGEGPMGARIVVDLSYALPRPTVAKESNRLIVVVPKRFQLVEETSIERGIVYGSVRAGEVHGPLSVKYLKVDLTRPDILVRPDLSGPSFGRAGLREIVARAGAIAGVNGGFFHWNGRPLGLLITDGELVSEALYRRTAFGIDGNGKAFIARLGTELWVETPGQKVVVDGINRPRAAGEIVVYTASYGPLPQSNGAWLYVEDDRVTQSGWPSPPDGGFALQFDARDVRLAGLRPGDALHFGYSVTPEVPAGVVLAIGGGPQLVKDGKVAVTGREERFQPDVLVGRAPRSALGITEDGQLLLVVVDGRSDARSVGVTLSELAEWMIRLGAESAMNLDGGGSSTLVLNGLILNQPSDGEERPIASAILVFLADDVVSRM